MPDMCAERSRSRSRSRSVRREWNFEKDGLCVLRGVLDPAKDLDPIFAEFEARLSSVLSDLVAQGKIESTWPGLSFADRIGRLYSETGGEFVQDFNISVPVKAGLAKNTPVNTGPAVFALLRNPHILDAVADILGDEVLSNPIQHARVKPPERHISGASGQGLIRGIPWHQDQAATTPDADGTNMVTVWVPITDALKEHGCMVVIPGSHTQGLLNHCPGMSIPEKVCPRASEGVPLPMRQGDILLMHKLTIHSSLSNVSENYCRISVDLRYSAAGSPTGRAALPSFVARSRANPDQELKDPEAYAAMWQKTIEKLNAAQAGTLHHPHRWDNGEHQPKQWQAMVC